MTTTVKYEAVLEYEDDEVPADVRENMRDLVSRQPDFGSITVEVSDDE